MQLAAARTFVFWEAELTQLLAARFGLVMLVVLVPGGGTFAGARQPEEGDEQAATGTSELAAGPGIEVGVVH
jgi:hypothetical protein